MGHMSNRERIARAAAEAQIAATERATKKPAKVASGSSPRRAAKAVRMKVVWEVCTGNGKVVKTFAYADKAAAEAAVSALTKANGQTYILRDTKVPME